MFTELFPIVTVRDLARALRFYGELMGGEVTYRFPPAGEGDPVYVSLRFGTSEIGLAADADRPAAPSVVELCVYAEDCDAAVRRLRTGGAVVVTEPEDQPWGERMARVEDPDGNRLLVLSRLTPADPVAG